MISPYFVPMNRVGAKRALHFVRHLPRHGWEPAVIALPERIERDPDLVPLVPAVPMLRAFRCGPVALAEDALHTLGWAPRRKVAAPAAGSRKPGGLGSAFDRYAKYLPFVFPRALLFLTRHRCDVIHANAGPFSALELGAALARMTGLPFVADLRDPWSIEPNSMAERGALAQRVVAWREGRCFAAAARIIVNTEAARTAYVEHYAGRIDPGRFVTIRNCFDPALYGAMPDPPGPEEPLRIVYYGHLRATKNAVQFLFALSEFTRYHEIGAGGVELITLGTRTAADEAAIDDLGLGGIVKDHGWLPFTRCRELLGRADLLLDLMGPDHGLQISGKFYDYLACRRPILCVSPNTEMDAILAWTKSGRRVPNEVPAIRAALDEAWDRKHAGVPFTPDDEAVAAFTAAPATRRLAAILDEVAE